MQRNLSTEMSITSNFSDKDLPLSNMETTTESFIDTTNLLEAVKASDKKKILASTKIENAIQDSLFKDESPEAKMGRKKMALRAAYGEFMCSLLFYGPIFFTIANCTLTNWNPNDTALAVAFVGGFQAIGVSFAFSSVSGAHFNSAISFALWLTGKLSNRKAVMYISVQMLASIVAMAIVSACFGGDVQLAFNACAVVPSDTKILGKVLATEFFLTFFLTYVAFTVAFEDAERQKKESMSFKTISDSRGLTLYASTPQSKTGFAPFSIGLMIFSLSLAGGASGGAFNPGRMLGPAVFSGKWDYLWLYWIGELMGAACAGLLVSNMHRFGVDTRPKHETSAKEAISDAMNATGDDAVVKHRPVSGRAEA